MSPFPLLSLLDFDGFRITDVSTDQFQAWFTPELMKKEGRPLVVVQVNSEDRQTIHTEVVVLSRHKAASGRIERQITARLWGKFCEIPHAISFTQVAGVKTHRDDVHRDPEGVWGVLKKIVKNSR